MKNLKKTKFATIALILLLTISIPFTALPSAVAVDTMKTYAYIGAVPDPVGIGQNVLLHFGNPIALSYYPLGWENLTVTITKPDNTTITLGPFKTDSTGGTGAIFVPTQAGTYYLQAHFPEQVSPVTITKRTIVIPAGTVMLADDSEKLALTVQEEPVPTYPGVPLPTEYWSRPIDSQFREWAPIAGNWLMRYTGYGMEPTIVPYNDDAPESPHVLWAKPLLGGAFSPLGGGLSGGLLDGLPHAFEDGDAYEGLFGQPLIIGGVLYFNRYKSGGSYRVEQEVVAADLRTGEELWVRPLIDSNGGNRRLSFGQTLNWNGFNIHEVYAYLWTTVGSTMHAYEASSGRWVYSMTNVPSGKILYGPNGELIKYTVNVAAGWMTKWNSTRVVTQKRILDYGPTGSNHGSWLREFMGTTLDASTGIEWNKTLPTGIRGTLSDTFFTHRIFVDERMIGEYRTPTSTNIWSVSLKPGQEGQLLFNTTWQPPQNVTLSFGQSLSLEDGVFAIYGIEARQWWGFSLETGKQIWGPTEPQTYLDFIEGLALRPAIYNGKLITSGMGGIVYAYNVTTGELAWSYQAKDPYALSETYQKETGGNNWPMKPMFFTDGKVYLMETEHSPDDPKARGAPFIALDVDTGKEVFRVNSLLKGTDWGGHAIIGDSIIATMDTYDQRVYAIGKGPSSTAVFASPEVSVYGSSVLIKGTVTDISPGTDDPSLMKRFPNGVPAVSDVSMGDWMLYVYKNFPRPTNVTGIEVSLSVIDSNGNYREIGTTTSNSDGFFTFTWQADIEGDYTVYAAFAGSKSYWPSHAVTSFVVDPAPATTAPTAAPQASAADMYFVPAVAGIIVAIIIVGAVLALLTIRKRP